MAADHAVTTVIVRAGQDNQRSNPIRNRRIPLRNRRLRVWAQRKHQYFAANACRCEFARSCGSVAGTAVCDSCWHRGDGQRGLPSTKHKGQTIGSWTTKRTAFIEWFLRSLTDLYVSQSRSFLHEDSRMTGIFLTAPKNLRARDLGGGSSNRGTQPPDAHARYDAPMIARQTIAVSRRGENMRL